MTFTHTTSARLGLAILAGLAGSAAFAQAPTGWYGGASIGRSAATIDSDAIRSGLSRSGLATTSIEERDRDTAYKLFGGYQFGPHLGVEAGFFDLGSFGYTARTTPAGTLGGDIRVKGLNLDLVGTLPLTERFSVLGRVGVAHTRTSGSFAASGAAAVPYGSNSPSARATMPKLGVGVAYQFTEALSLRLEAERYRIKDAVGHKGDVDVVSAGLVYHFGAPAPRPRPMAVVAPAPVAMVAAPAPAPAPAPVVAAAPAPKPLMRVSLSAGSLFDFDQSTLKPAGRQALDKLVADLRPVQYDSVRVTGHTDRLGRAEHNQALSQQRARAVGAYLSESGGIAPARIVTTGAGETQPVTATGDCKGDAPNARTIACLQADRRVEVEVAGSRRD